MPRPPGRGEADRRRRRAAAGRASTWRRSRSTSSGTSRSSTRRYRKQREQAGESVGKLTPEGFQKALADRIAQIKREQRCEAVLVRVVSENGKTRIVAKPFRRGAGKEGAEP